jgi:hypothetical protein
MTALTPSELRPGLCAFLDHRVLMECPGSRANVRTRANLVNRPGPFLVVAALPDDTWLCVPLVSHAGSGKHALDQALKSGPGNGWLHRASYFSVHQFWIIPGACIVEASGGEFSPEGKRQRYADKAPEALEAVARRQFDSDAPYRVVSQLP